MKTLFCTGLFLMLLSCGPSPSRESDASTVDIQQAYDAGRQVSTLAQATLLNQVGQALAEGDAAHAVRVCNVEALAIVDSLNQAHNCSVRRLTTRRRNPANKIESSYDRIAWNSFRSAKPADNADTVLLERGVTPVYYKPIFIASELCLQCHGSRSTQIALETLESIDTLYPEDAAVNYVLGDLRGMWKVAFAKE
ncbi:MAG: DUF3365 domain-containing protein [Saprospiraceae bacterium]|nr:DUF3365 domain-containing protein [Saprospiraceae bacterium]